MPDQRGDDAVGNGRATPLVGIGASAGGLESLEALFAELPADLGMAYVVVQHLSPTHRSLMPELLGRVTAMPVEVAVHGAAVRPNTVTLIPPGQFLTVAEGRLRLEPKPLPPTLTLPIDRFFESMAEEWGDSAVAIVLSGTGSDGTRGARRVRASGGLVLAEDPALAQFDGMPRSAIDADAVDLVLPSAEIGRYLARLAVGTGTGAPARGAPAALPGDTVARIAAVLHRDSGVDFTRYKRATVGRRVGRRMAAHGIDSADEYLALLSGDAGERDLLYRELLIRVTSFFRDPEVWEALTTTVIAPLVAAATAHDTLRLWVPACSTGEEAYTLAMVVLDEIRRQDRPLELKVFATDIDRDGLELAATGRYRDAQMAGVDEARVERYFARLDGRYTVTAELRRRVMFAHHNVTRDAPFTRLDVISCRNLFIYLHPELQRSVLGAFHFALNPSGALVLGSSESLGEHADRFAPVDATRKIFRSVGERRATAWAADFRQPAPTVPLVTGGPWRSPLTGAATGRQPVVAERALRLLVDQFAPPAVLVDELGLVRHVFGDVSPYLRVAAGTPTMQVLDMCRAEIGAPLAAGLPRVRRTGERVVFPVVLADATGGDAHVDVVVEPVDEGRGAEGGHLLVAFCRAEVALADRPDPVDAANVQIAELHAELGRSRLAQQQLVEQLESSNEELQATNEEMVAANEELQAANEELQSVNEELFTVNAENTRRIHELEVLRHDLDHLLTATDVGTLVVDDRQIIRRFTRSVSEFLPILERDVGRPIAHLANSLGGEAFLGDLERVITTRETCERSIDSIHGQVLVRMIPYRMREMSGALVTFVDVSTVKRNYEVSRRVLDALPAHVAFLDRTGTITMVNAAWESFAAANGGVPDRTGPGANYFSAATTPEGLQVIAGIQSVLRGERTLFTHVYPCDAPDGGPQWYLLRCTPVGPGEAVVVHFDITAQKLAENVLQGLATHDPLTGAMNRRGIEAELETVLRRARRFGRQASAVLLDCDDFKRVNDRVGHAGGDAVLRAVARRIEGTLRAGDTFARIGGDEFLVLLPEASLDAAHAAAERVRLAVAGAPIAVAHEDISLTVSEAVVELDSHVFTLEHLLDRCRTGLQDSKTHGKNRVTATAPPVTGDARAGLAQLLERNQLVVAVQPIVATHTAEVVAAELLLRSAAQPPQPPAAIFRAAMEEGMLSAVDEHALMRCLEAAMGLPHPGRRHVNVFPSTLLAMGPDRLRTIFDGRSDAEHPMAVELSERQMLGDPADLLPALRHLRTFGVEVALDDVGFGRTSLETLLIVEPSIVKIDAACIRGIDTDGPRRRWLRRLVAVARSLGCELVAEGVEHEAELAVVADLGIERCQGYLFAEPALIG